MADTHADTHTHPHPDDERSDLDALLDRLRADGVRVTTARRAVLEELLRADEDHDHLGAEELAARVNRRHPDIHLSTIYRTLDALEHAGLLDEVHLGPGPSSYHFRDHRHHHAVCTGCGAVIALPGDIVDEVNRRLLDDHGFVAEPSHLTFTGRCRDCAR